MIVTYSITRNIWRSVKEYLQSKATNDALNVVIAASFSYAYESDNTDIPIITIGLEDIIPTRKEIGSNELRSTYRLVIDIFATSEGEKLDLTEWVTEAMKSGCTYNEYVVDSLDSNNMYNAEIVTKVANGKIENKLYLSSRNVRLGSDASGRDKHRRVLILDVILNKG